jgi:cyclohexa-1,5-dienecarbonyl-CoA hydratase
MITFETLEVSLMEDDTLLHLYLRRPPGNVLTLRLVHELSAALEAHREVPELRLVVLRGAGGNFSYGASIEQHTIEQAPEVLRGFHRLLQDLAAYPIPSAALVEGSCLSRGFELALCCNFLFATKEARFGCPEIKLGVFPPLLAILGSRRLGSFIADRLLLTGENMDSECAERLGLLTDCFAAGEDPEAALLAWYRRTLRPLSAFALRQGTQALRHGSGWQVALSSHLRDAERRLLDEVLPSHDGHEGITAFLEKRSPIWRDS